MERNFDCLCTLLRLGLGFDIDKAAYENFDGHLNWDDMVRLASMQGVLSLAFEGAMKLPKEIQPPRKAKINWGVNVEYLKEKSQYHYLIIRRLVSLFGEQGIKMMLLKGRGMALCYPDAFLREESDIDIYLLGKFEEGNDLLKRQGVDFYEGYEKHAKFCYHGISVENHKFFLDCHSVAESSLESYLQECLEEKIIVSDLGEGLFVYAPSPDFNAVFLIKHALNHLWRTETALRHICDWACFLSRYAEEIDFNRYRSTMQKAGLLHLADAFTAITVDRLGLDEGAVPPFDRNRKIEKRLVDKLKKNPLQQPVGQSVWGKLAYEYKRLKEEQDVYSLFFSKGLFFRAKNKILRGYNFL